MQSSSIPTSGMVAIKQNSIHQQQNASHSLEKSRSRNKKHQLSQNQTATGINNKFDSTLLDMHFKTTTSTSTQ